MFVKIPLVSPFTKGEGVAQGRGGCSTTTFLSPGGRGQRGGESKVVSDASRVDLSRVRGGRNMPRFVSMDLYNRYKEDVWRLTNARQRFEPGKAHRGLTDQEIASRLGLSVGEVIEIRCIAENDNISLEAHLDADDTKEKRFNRPPVAK